jgi:hypothetical protein
MVRTLRLGPAFSAEMVGPSDIVRPWEKDLIPSVLPATAEWRVLHDARVALLDGRTTALIGRWPELSAAVSGRLLRRTSQGRLARNDDRFYVLRGDPPDWSREKLEVAALET